MLVWEGIMGALLEPAVLFRETLNLEAMGERRSERLSTGRYTLTDVRCKGCSQKLGWRYIEAGSLVRCLPPRPPCLHAQWPGTSWATLARAIFVPHAASHPTTCAHQAGVQMSAEGGCSVHVLSSSCSCTALMRGRSSRYAVTSACSSGCDTQEQKYKEGCSLLQKGLLQLVDARAHDEAAQRGTQQHSVAVHC